ncbi:MAG: aminotransferase class I/II-fold pyridoxal phosphate-dependent enzyme [Treponema sp.]|jgi:aspartate/methionine/tyrosine aminotransferase|nr:aminotransferase class I/II-fold pyridoxal phosphate-dependent enzyme [Treponema sp.]
MNVLAEELNNALEGTIAGRMLSKVGRRIYFPKGIIAQSAEAKKAASKANATIGMAFSHGSPLLMSVIKDAMPVFKPSEIVAYAPTAGVEEARLAWKNLLSQKNPSITEHTSLPVVVSGLTAGISLTASLFLDEEQTILASAPCWDNYELIFQERYGASLKEIPFFNGGAGLDMDSIEKGVREQAETGVVRIILNFPNNPSGYSPTIEEAEKLIGLFKDVADKGTDMLIICDDAYFGLFYEDHIIQESIFCQLSTLHERILAVKIDGPTKEDYAWGLRMGFMTFGSRNLTAVHYDALVKKLTGAIRSTVSCANTPAQYLMLKTMNDPRTPVEKDKYFNILKNRYLAVKKFVSAHAEDKNLHALPFNSGYFMSFRCMGVKAETLRQRLLAKGVGVVALGDAYIRVAFSSIEEEDIPAIYHLIYEEAAVLGESQTP